MRNRTALTLFLGTALASCNSGPAVEAENASVSEVAEKIESAAGADNFVSPGKWESKITIEEVSMPGMPPEAAAQMKNAMSGHAQSVQTCLTPEQVKRPREDFFAGAQQSCRYDRFSMGNGKIDAVMKCSMGGATQVMQMAGTYTPNAYSMTMTSSGSGQGPAGMKMRMRVDAKRLGACDGTETKG